MSFVPEFKRYTQQMKLTEIGVQGQQKLQHAKVLCIGAGGLGVTLLTYLAGAGLGTLGIVDDDRIEESNLHRQTLYQEQDVGKAKATVAKMKLQALNSTIDVHAHMIRLTADNAQALIAQYDLVADCSDNFYTRYLVHDTCYRLDKPYVYASAYQFQGHCSFFYGNENPCLHCLFPLVADNGANCENGGVLGTLPGLLGMLQATEIIKWVVSSKASLLNRLFCIDFLTMDTKKIQLVKNDECPFCVYGHSLNEEDFGLCNQLDGAFTVLGTDLAAFLASNPELCVLDVRTAEEHHQYNLGGQLMSLAELPTRLQELDRLQPTLVYCQSGRRSQRALLLLKEAGFCRVYHLAQGIDSLL